MLLLLLMMVNIYKLIKWFFTQEVKSSVILYHKVIIVIMPIMFISLKGISRAEIDHVTELYRMEKNEGQSICKVCGKASNKKSNIQNHAEIYMRVYYMIDVSAALHFKQDNIFKDTYPTVGFILHSFMDLLLVSSKTTLSSCFLITYPAKIFYVFVNRIVMFRQMFL